ncbi:HlyD family secretion protein [Shewanella maritima]|uniref:HlyD family secretion protein n=1 Tax=Shewanella maritima TaxID=2520507 RepID=A0A411PDK9_9GAMM|nr:HlyD family secretion protein [Shewanella maritima]QBF81542.1 HlyD family secretion protein [Shewanella maritima]
MNTNKRLILPGIGIGAAALVLSVVLKPGPDKVDGFDNSRVVEVFTLEQVDVAPVIEGFGRVSPKHVWQALSEVGGKVIYRHPQLETGRTLAKGTKLLEIDPLEYELNLAQAKASLNSTEAQLVKLDQQLESLKTNFDIEQQKLKLVEQEYQRKQTLKKRNLVSSSELESQKQALLAQQNALENIQNSLDTWPDDKKVTEAQKQVDLAKVQDAERRLAQTQVVLPFDARLSDVNIELNQVVSIGQVMLVAHQLGSSEIKAEMSLQNMRVLATSLEAAMPEHAQRFAKASDNGAMPSIDRFELNGEVQFQAGNNQFSWPAKVTRVAETVNANQGTIGVYLEVEQDYNKLNLLERPPLTKGMFVKARIEGKAAKHFSVPEQAIHTNNLYVMQADSTLKIVPVEVLFRHEGGVAVRGDVTAGEQLVVNDLIPAIEGMKLRVVDANKGAE